MSETGIPVSRSTIATNFFALSGNASNEVIPSVLLFQPVSVS
jgi:hypothetical protein